MEKLERKYKLTVALGLILIAIFLIEGMQDGGERGRGGVTPLKSAVELKEGKYPKAPEIQGTVAWINSNPLTLMELRGKVVLIDFWTYSCINCIRTLPYLKSWDDKYRKEGLVIIGVHSPEFSFEKKLENVQKAVDNYEIRYPVALDNNHATWRAFNNRFWPHKYLIDSDGFIRYDHIGEGAYEETEMMIQALLNERLEKMGEEVKMGEEISKPEETIDVDFSKIGSPEIYLGYSFARTRNHLGNREGFQPEEVVSYKLPNSYEKNLVYLQGDWLNKPDYMEYVGEGEGKVVLQYTAKAVNIVAGALNGAVINIRVDDTILSNEDKGRDVIIESDKSYSIIRDQKLYNIIFEKDYGTHTVEIRIENKGFRIYTFTFG